MNQFYRSGLGRDLTIAALKRGDKVIATARKRSLDKLDDLKAQGADILELDVTAPLETLNDIAKKAVKLYGRVDVLVNNAGAIEENTPEETFDQFNTNVFGALNVCRAFLPYMRARKSGTIIFIGSIGGWRSLANAGLYATTKFALRGISLSLHDEISPLGLRSICTEFGYFRTPLLDTDHRAPQISRIPDYKPITDKANASLEKYNLKQPGDPKKGVEVMIDVVRGEGQAKGKPFPTVLELGSDCYTSTKAVCENMLTSLEEWKEVTFSTDF
ncbi:hypothetical protein H0H93_002997 [Arthromyces matolae]|nr:hypothetical protein H0H93_002997 [Arthromyces matolae]